METLKRILAGVVIVLCLLGILVAALGIVTAWRINTPLTESLTQLLTGIDGILEVVETGLITFNTALTDLVDLAQTIETTVVEAGVTVKETNLMLLVIDATIGDKLVPLLEKASATIEIVVDSVIAVNDALEAVNAVPFISVPTLTADLEAAESGLLEIQKDIEETHITIQTAKEETVESVVSPISNTLLEVDDNLRGVLSVSTEFESQVVASREAIAVLVRKLPGWIDLGSFLLTLIFAWLIIAQGSLLLRGYAYVRTGELKVSLGGSKDPKEETTPKSEGEYSSSAE